MRCTFSALLVSFYACVLVMAQDAQRGPDNTSPGHIPGVTVLPIPGRAFSGMV
jgi:hypothetical protein